MIRLDCHHLHSYNIHHFRQSPTHSPNRRLRLYQIASYLNPSAASASLENPFPMEISLKALTLPLPLQVLRLLPSGSPLLPFIHSSTDYDMIPHSQNPSLSLLLSSPCLSRTRILGLFRWNCLDIFLSFPQTTMLKICRSISLSGFFKMELSRFGKSIPFPMFSLREGWQSTAIMLRYMGVTRSNSYFP